MENVLTNKEKIKLIFLGICRSLIFICWYAFAIVIAYFVSNKINDTRVELLIIFLVIIYTIRNILKAYHRHNANKIYHTYKHKIEMKYFKRIKDIDNGELSSMDRDNLGKKILEYSYTKAKVVSDVIEFIIPGVLGIIVFIVGAVHINYILGIISLVTIIILLVIRHFYLTKRPIDVVSNYNDLLCDFVNKALTIKRLGIFSFCERYLDSNKDNDAIVLKNNDYRFDILFITGISITLAIMLGCTYFILDRGVEIVGYLLFFVIIFFKLQDLLYEFNPALINFINVFSLKRELNTYYANTTNYKYIRNWKNINIENGVVKYNDISIKVPSFEFVKGDQVSIIGKSGEGKSTILNVLSGIDKLDEGVLTIDNQETDEIIDAVYLSNSTDLFNMSLRDNLSLGEKISDDELLSLIKEIGLSDWYDSLSNGLDTIMDERYDKNIKKELMRLNIIRGIILDKQVYFLDEPIDNIDMDTEKIIVAMIKKYFKKKTFIIITDRPTLTTICKKHYFMKKHTLLDKEPLL